MSCTLQQDTQISEVEEAVAPCRSQCLAEACKPAAKLHAQPGTATSNALPPLQRKHITRKLPQSEAPSARLLGLDPIP